MRSDIHRPLCVANADGVGTVRNKYNRNSIHPIVTSLLNVDPSSRPLHTFLLAIIPKPNRLSARKNRSLQLYMKWAAQQFAYCECECSVFRNAPVSSACAPLIASHWFVRCYDQQQLIGEKPAAICICRSPLSVSSAQQCPNACSLRSMWRMRSMRMVVRQVYGLPWRLSVDLIPAVLP